MKKMKVCFFLISGGWGGAENVVFYLAEALEKRGYDISIILNEETYPYFNKLSSVTLYNIGPIFTIRKFLPENFHLLLPKLMLKNKNILLGMKFVFGHLLIKLNFLKIQKKILQRIYSIDPDIIHLHNSAILDLCPQFLEQISYPIIYTSHGIDFQSKLSSIPWFRRKKRCAFRRFNKITAVSEFIEQYLISNGITKHIDVIYNGIDIELIGNIVKEKQRLVNNEEFKLIFTGGQKKQKGGEIILQAMRLIRQQDYKIKLFYCGFVTNEFLKKNQSKDVIFTGLLPHNEYLKLLSTCNCLILLSKTEGFPMTILEAMVLGKTIITTPVGGIPELVQNGINGFFVQRSTKDFVNKIFYIYNNPKICKQISINNLQTIKKFDWNNIITQYIELYEKTRNYQ